MNIPTPHILNQLKPKQALNKAFLKLKPTRAEIEKFKANLITLLDGTNISESEEHHKNLLSDFLKKTYYDPAHSINTKARTDLVIHTGSKTSTPVGVIIETKKPTNKAEMLSTSKLNVKAFQELVLYYLRERITLKTLEIKHLIATNINEWFIFDVTVFDRLFAQNETLVARFTDFEAGRLADKTTDFFYTQIAEPFIAAISSEIEFTYFNFQDYQQPLRNANKADDALLIALFKLLSPEHLLKLSFLNDSNTLDKRFYAELLHIIGLTETKNGGKKLIERHKPDERQSGSMLEDTILQLDSQDKLDRLPNKNQYGNTREARLFNVALELSITWINRILFLKLLEAQLISYHKGDKTYAFLNSEIIHSYDHLNRLFFQVLARRHEERNDDVKSPFQKVPYLNSSLFEPTPLEQDTLVISNLVSGKTIPILSATVLKDREGKKRSGNLSTLQYLFEFLNAYDFGSEGAGDIQEDNKTLINASVLGLIFEKINGYKDGSFFTPGFITMYMCRETIRKAVVQQFNDAKGWDCKELNDVYDKIEDRDEANRIVNSLKICDPAVGSGHFLVSALNEIIAVKHDLKILQDRQGRRLKEYQIEVVSDELDVRDEDDNPFKYTPTNPESQRIQETLFHEKQTLIENCLFGVDINANSVKICRLRLWIELLKNAYYKNPTELETLPNIDINIKCGNSLVSRFALDADLKQALQKSKWTIEAYRLAVDTYRNAESKEEKREMEGIIASVKSDFTANIDHPFKKKISAARGRVEKLEAEMGTRKQWGEKADKKLFKDFETASKQLVKLEAERDDITSNRIYENAFEWRFEFPEVLSDAGDFLGFDVVIGNPPYVSTKGIKIELKDYYLSNYEVSKGQFDLYWLFTERAYNLLHTDSYFAFITSNTFISNKDCDFFRKFLIENTTLVEIVNLDETIFTDASLDVAIFRYRKNIQDNYIISVAKNKESFLAFERNELPKSKVLTSPTFDFRINLTETDWEIVTKVEKNPRLSEFVEIARGMEFGGNSKLIKKEYFKNSLPIIKGNSISKYAIKKFEGYVEHDSDNLSVFKNLPLYTTPRILLQRIRNLSLKDRIVATYTTEQIYCTNTVRIMLPKETNEINLKTLTGILNSKLINYYFWMNFMNKDIYSYQLQQIPIAANRKIQHNIQAIVEEILQLKQTNSVADIGILESQIDQLVYQLYGLTEEEIAIVENN